MVLNCEVDIEVPIMNGGKFLAARKLVEADKGEFNFR